MQFVGIVLSNCQLLHGHAYIKLWHVNRNCNRYEILCRYQIVLLVLEKYDSPGINIILCYFYIKFTLPEFSLPCKVLLLIKMSCLCISDKIMRCYVVGRLYFSHSIADGHIHTHTHTHGIRLCKMDAQFVSISECFIYNSFLSMSNYIHVYNLGCYVYFFCMFA